MMVLLKHMVYVRRTHWSSVLLILLYALTILILLKDYLPWNSVNFILGIGMLPFTIEKGKVSKGFAWEIMALLFALLSFILPVNTIVFFALLCGLLAMAVHRYGKLTILPILTLLLMTPIVHYAIGIFSFPIRLQLTSVAGSILQLIGQEVTVNGNLVTCNGYDYSVDPACMGLKMLLTSLLCGILIITMLKKKVGKQINTLPVFFLLAVVLLLNIIANLSRIILLVYFNILPEQVMHEVIGIVCLIVYILLPFIVIVRWWIIKYGKTPAPVSISQDVQPLRSSSFFHLMVIVLVVIAAMYRKPMHDLANINLPMVPGYTSSLFAAGVLQYKSDRSLVYIKKITGFYSSEHNPMICWVGGGYTFESISEQTIGGLPVLTGVLKKDKERLYTAWWYDNGVHQTISQLKWRWDAARSGRNYSVVNITTGNNTVLQEEVKRILHHNTFRQVLKE